MQTEYTQDQPKLSPEQVIEEAAKERPGKPIKLRIQPMIFRGAAGGGGQYRSWTDVSWTVDCDTTDEVFSLREALRLFFAALSKHGPAVVMQRLRDAA